jgi:hypothetical protein
MFDETPRIIELFASTRDFAPITIALALVENAPNKPTSGAPIEMEFIPEATENFPIAIEPLPFASHDCPIAIA